MCLSESKFSICIFYVYEFWKILIDFIYIGIVLYLSFYFIPQIDNKRAVSS